MSQTPPTGGPSEASAPPERARLSVAMIARDEEGSIGRSLDSVAWADEVVVLDSGSRDRTPGIARGRGARVVETGDWPGYGAQKQRALERVEGPWVLFLDADEVVSPELADEIRELLREGPRAAGYELEFHTCYLGHWFGRRGWYRERHLRLARKDAVEVSGDPVHEGMRVEGEVGRLEGPVLHYTYRDAAHHLEKLQRYSGVKAREMAEAGRETGLAGAVGHAAGHFLSDYLMRGRFLEGWPGLVHAALGAYSKLMTYLKLWERTGRDGTAEEGADGPR